MGGKNTTNVQAFQTAMQTCARLRVCGSMLVVFCHRKLPKSHVRKIGFLAICPEGCTLSLSLSVYIYMEAPEKTTF